MHHHYLLKWDFFSLFFFPFNFSFWIFLSSWQLDDCSYNHKLQCYCFVFELSEKVIPPSCCQLWTFSKFQSSRINLSYCMVHGFSCFYFFIHLIHVTYANDITPEFPFLVAINYHIYFLFWIVYTLYKWKAVPFKFQCFSTPFVISCLPFGCFFRIYCDAGSQNSWMCLCCYVLFCHPHSRLSTNRSFRRWICKSLQHFQSFYFTLVLFVWQVRL